MFEGMNHHDLLDVAEVLLMTPLERHPEEFAKFRDEVLYAPMEGTKAAKRRAQREALAAMGVDLDEIVAQHAKRAADSAPAGG